MSQSKTSQFIDRALPYILVGIVLVLLFLALKSLSTVLLPFFAAWLVAYMLDPLVSWVQRLVKHRVGSVAITLVVLTGVLVGLLVLIVPILVTEARDMGRLISDFIAQQQAASGWAADLYEKADQYTSDLEIASLMEQEGFASGAQDVLTFLWDSVSGAVGILVSLFSTITFVLYLVFILIDYDTISAGWLELIPKKYRSAVDMIVGDLEDGMNRYFKAQSKVVLIMCVLFAIGFKIIGLPFGILLGILVGLLNFIPYLQLIGLLPALFFAAVHSLETDANFWWMLALVIIVFTVVQLIQEAWLTPKFMGKMSGLNPAVILLSLSIWGSLLGVIGLIIAIPSTTIIVSYYRRFVIKPTENKG